MGGVEMEGLDDHTIPVRACSLKQGAQASSQTWMESHHDSIPIMRCVRSVPKNLRRRIRQPCQRLSSKDFSSKDGRDDLLVDFRGVTVKTPAHLSLSGVDFVVHSQEKGGHALFGPNGAGKTQLLLSLLEQQEGGKSIPPQAIQYVSFESHQELLRQGGTVYTALTKGMLNRAAQFLVVRFGLYPLLHQHVNTLSNGQIKKLLIVQALSKRPQLLILDNAFDGLDIESRQILRDITAKILQGFKRDRILVQAVDARNTAKTQVLVSTHRFDDVVDEIEHANFLDKEHHLTRIDHKDISVTRFQHMFTERRNDSSETLKELSHVLGCTFHKALSSQVVELDRVGVVTPEGKHLLDNVNWKIERGQRWLLHGPNGAGKSTLSRLLVLGDAQEGFIGTLTRGRESAPDDQGSHPVGWVSTEKHLELFAEYSESGGVLDVPNKLFGAIAEHLGILHLRGLPFATLSQGEQRLMMIVAELSLAPDLLVLDEPCQSLDESQRESVLSLIDLVCEQTEMALVYITHHYPEDKLSSLSHMISLDQGQVSFKGAISGSM